MFWAWVPFELFIALNCSQINATFVVPLVLLIWAIDTRWIWAETPRVASRQTESEIDAQKWTRRGRSVLLLLVLLIDDEALVEGSRLQRDTFQLTIFLVASLNHLQAVAKPFGYVESCIWSAASLCACYAGGTLDIRQLLLMQLIVVGVTKQDKIVSPHTPSASHETPSGEKVAIVADVKEAPPQTHVESAKKPEEEGTMLIQAMAPQIILDMLSESDVFVSALCERNGTYRWVSNSVQKLYGYSSSELIGTSGWSTVHPDDIQYLMHVNRDRSNRVRMQFRRRRKDGTYVPVESFGLYSEGFFFFQEYTKKELEPPVADIRDFDPTTATTGNLARSLFSSQEPLQRQIIEVLVLLHRDATGEPIRLGKVDLRECIQEVARHGVMQRDHRKLRGQANSKFRVTFTDLAEATENQLIVQSNGERFVASLSGVIDALFELEENQDVAVEVIANGNRECTVSFIAARFPQNDVRVECAKSFVMRVHRGRIGYVPGAVSRLDLRLSFSRDSVSRTCLIVDDDKTILRIMQKRLGPIWRELHGTDLDVLTATTGQDAIQIAKDALPNKFEFVSVDLGLGEDSVLTGEDTVRKLKEMNCASRVVVLTATARPKMDIGDTVYLKGAPDLYRELCRKAL